MLDIGAEVFNGGVGAFVKIPIGVVHIPQGAGKVAGEAFQHFPQPCGIGVNAAGLDQKGNAGFFRGFQQNGQVFLHLRFVILQCAGGNIGNSGIGGNRHDIF